VDDLLTNVKFQKNMVTIQLNELLIVTFKVGVMITEAEKKWQVLVVGNNPIELSDVVNQIDQIRHQPFITKIAFDLRSSLDCLATFSPSYILIDDNIGDHELRETIHQLSRNRKTKDVPITVLKNSNYQHFVNNEALNYLLKSNLTAERLYKSLTQAFTPRAAQQFLRKAYRKRKGQLMRLLAD